MAWSDKQKSVVRGAAFGASATLTALILTLVVDMPVLQMSALPDRLRLLAICLFGPALCLAAAIGALGQHRFNDPVDIDAAVGPERTQRAAIMSAILQNTGEQTLLATLIYGAAAILLPSALTPALGYCAALFVVGRLLFAHGYEKGAGGRAAGFALTFYPTLMLAIMTLITALF
jgi:hypothetical protein